MKIVLFAVNKLTLDKILEYANKKKISKSQIIQQLAIWLDLTVYSLRDGVLYDLSLLEWKHSCHQSSLREGGFLCNL